MNVAAKSQPSEGDPTPVGKPSLIWLASLWSCGAVILYVLASGLGGVVSLDADRAAYEKRRTDEAAGLETLQQDVVRRRDETVELAKQAAALKSELQTTASQKIKAVDQTTAAQADLKATNDEYQIELQRLRTLEAEHARLTADLATLKQRSEQATAAAARLAEEQSTLEQRKSKLAADVEGLTSKRDALLADLKTTNVSLTDVETRLADERKKFLDKQKEVGDAMAALVPLTAEAARIAALIAREESLKSSIASLTLAQDAEKKKVDDLKTESTSLKTEVDGLEAKAAVVRGILDQATEIRKRVEGLLAAEAAAIKKKAIADQEATTAEADATAAKQLKFELPPLQTKKADLEAELKTLQTSRDAAVTAKTALDRETAALRTANDEQVAARSALKIEVDSLNSKRDALEKEIERKSKTPGAAGEGAAAAAKSDATTAEKAAGFAMISSSSILYLLAMSGTGVFLGLTGWTAFSQLRARNRYNAYISRMPKAVEYADVDRLVREKRSEWEDLTHRTADAGELVRKKEEAARWLLDNAALTERIAADREIHAKLTEDLDALKKEIAAQQQLHGRYKLAILELEAKIKQLAEKEQEAAAQVASAKADANQQALELRQKLEVAKEQTRLQEEALLQQIRSFEERESELNSRVNVAQQACAAAEERLRSKQSELDALASLVAERTAAAREAQQAFVADLERQAQERRTLLEIAIDELKQYRDGVEKGLVEKQGELQQESLRLDTTRSEFARLRGEADAEQVRLDGLRADVARELSDKPGGRKDDEQTADLWNGGLVSPSRVERHAQSQEAAELDKVAAHFEGMGLRFHRRTLDAFHTSLKVADISPLVVLAGISGTGKSELPRRYAEAMQMHYLCLPVQPRWDSPQDMFGFFNYLEHRYRATPLSRALVQMDPFHAEADRGWSTPNDWESRHDQMLLVLLDEMNLARVEYYFSEFLSRLETRRSVNKLNPESRKDAEIILETGLKGGSSMRLFVDNNVLFVGTMNEDESTQTLSDKVIDRSNVIRFGRPSRLDSKRPKPNEIENNHAAQPRLSHKSWRSWIRDDQENAPWSSVVDGWLKRVNDALTIVHRPFGYRAHQSIRTYVANYPEVERAERWKLAFVDQIEQKILPKFRGVDVSDGKSAQAIRDIKELIGELGDEALRKAVDVANRDHQFAWTGFDRPESEGR